MHDRPGTATPLGQPQLAFRMPVEAVDGREHGTRVVLGKVASGSISAGDDVVALPSGTVVRVSAITANGEGSACARAGDAVVLTFDRVVPIIAGEIICNPEGRAQVAAQFSTTLAWTSSRRLLKGRPYLMFCNGQHAIAQISAVRHRTSVEGERKAATDLGPGETGVCHVSLDRDIAFDPVDVNPATAAFTLADRATGEMVASGSITFALRRAHNIHWQQLNVSRDQRAALKGQKPCCLWLTGLSGAGKSAIANLIDARLFNLGRHTCLLDGDNVRHGLNKDLGFSEADRVENIRRVAEVARLMYDAGLIAIVSFISPFRAERQFARERFPAGDFLEIFVDTPLEVCEQRDPKGLYKKARAGQLSNFTGITSPYEPPQQPEIHIKGGSLSSEVDQIMSALLRGGFLHNG